MAIQDIPLEFVIFGLTLLGVALFHHHALLVALLGLVAASLLRIVGGAATVSDAVNEYMIHFAGEWVILANLLLLLLGFAIVSNQFERSGLPETIPSRLPDGWVGGVVLLGFVFCLSSFLDNIAGAIIGGVVARHVFPHGVTIAFQAAVVSAANAGGAGSVIGDTTTTMMWISGVGAIELLPAFIGAVVAFAVFAPFAAISQQRRSPLGRYDASNHHVDWARAWIVASVLATVVGVNVIANLFFPEHEDIAPVLGLGLWTAILLTAPLRAPDWGILREALKGAAFLVTLVALASLMPVDQLPSPSDSSVLGLGFLSAVFDNIPLTALALNQGGYDWALLAYAVGFGGSMVWFGSSAGVALTNLFPEGRSVVKWLAHGWFVPISYVIGFLVMSALT
jgi:Na+/H+ antiporter NhaD/arsenite permease-like protein